MIFDWMSTWTLHGWGVFCCTVASLGLVGAFWVALAVSSGRGIFAWLNQKPTIIVVNGGQYLAPAEPRTWGFKRTYCLCAAIFSGGPMLTLLAMWVARGMFYVTDWVEWHRWVLAVPPVVGTVALVVTFVLLRVHGERRAPVQRPEPVRALVPSGSEAARLGVRQER